MIWAAKNPCYREPVLWRTRWATENPLGYREPVLQRMIWAMENDLGYREPMLWKTWTTENLWYGEPCATENALGYRECVLLRENVLCYTEQLLL